MLGNKTIPGEWNGEGVANKRMISFHAVTKDSQSFKETAMRGAGRRGGGIWVTVGKTLILRS